MGAESVENCVDSSETAKDDTNETEQKIEQYEQTIRANKLSANDVIN